MKQFSFHHPRKKVFDAVKQAARSLDLEVSHESSADGRLQLSSSGGLFSFGNKIEVEIKISQSSISVLKVTSRSAAAIQVVDWGTNDDLEASIIDTVKNILH